MPKRELAGRIAVAGVGTTRYGKLPDFEYSQEEVERALAELPA